MTHEYLVGLFVLGLSLVWTPGPNNALMAASGARFGYRRTLPHTMGVAIGFPLMFFLIALGLGGVFRSVPLLREALRYGGALILLWIAYKIATAPMPQAGDDTHEHPWTFSRAVAFQWINPKAWVMSISLSGQLPETKPFWIAPLAGALVFLIAGLTSANGWTAFGAAIHRFLSTPLRFRAFNLVMAGLIVLTVAGILLADLSV